MIKTIIIQCSQKGDRHFQSVAKVEGDEKEYIKQFLEIQNCCHICNAKLQVIY